MICFSTVKTKTNEILRRLMFLLLTTHCSTKPSEANIAEHAPPPSQFIQSFPPYTLQGSSHFHEMGSQSGAQDNLYSEHPRFRNLSLRDPPIPLGNDLLFVWPQMVGRHEQSVTFHSQNVLYPSQSFSDYSPRERE